MEARVVKLKNDMATIKDEITGEEFKVSFHGQGGQEGGGEKNVHGCLLKGK